MYDKYLNSCDLLKQNILLNKNILNITAGPSYYAETSRSTHDQFSMCGNSQDKCKNKQKNETRPRTRFGSEEVKILDREFINQHRPNIYDRKRIATLVN